MLSIRDGLLAFAFALPQEAPPSPPPPPAATPQQQFDALMAEYNTSPRAGPMTDAERTKHVGNHYRHHYEVSLRLVEFVERHPKEPFAFQALVKAAWQVNGTPWPVELVGDDRASGRALALLQRDHADSAELGALCRRISWGHRAEYEPFLRALLDGSPHPQVRGVACLSLAHYLHQRLARLELLELQPASRAEFAALFGADHLERLRGLDRAAATREVESLLEQCSKEHGTVELPEGGTVGEKAVAELFELRHLRVGATAPDIEGEDQHGVRFKLSDYRGKVVLIDFWSWA